MFDLLVSLQCFLRRDEQRYIEQAVEQVAGWLVCFSYVLLFPKRLCLGMSCRILAMNLLSYGQVVC